MACVVKNLQRFCYRFVTCSDLVISGAMLWPLAHRWLVAQQNLKWLNFIFFQKRPLPTGLEKRPLPTGVVLPRKTLISGLPSVGANRREWFHKKRGPNRREWFYLTKCLFSETPCGWTSFSSELEMAAFQILPNSLRPTGVPPNRRECAGPGWPA